MHFVLFQFWQSNAMLWCGSYNTALVASQASCIHSYIERTKQYQNIVTQVGGSLTVNLCVYWAWDFGTRYGIRAQRAKGPQAEVLIYANALAIVDLPAMRVRSFLWMLQRSNANASGPQGWGSVRSFVVILLRIHVVVIERGIMQLTVD